MCRRTHTRLFATPSARTRVIFQCTKNARSRQISPPSLHSASSRPEANAPARAPSVVLAPMRAMAVGSSRSVASGVFCHILHARFVLGLVAPLTSVTCSRRILVGPGAGHRSRRADCTTGCSGIWFTPPLGHIRHEAVCCAPLRSLERRYGMQKQTRLSTGKEHLLCTTTPVRRARYHVKLGAPDPLAAAAARL